MPAMFSPKPPRFWLFCLSLGSLILSVLGSGERSAIEQEGEAPVPQATETIDGTIPPGSGIPEELTPAAPESDSQSPNSEVLIGTNAPGE